MTDIQRWNIGGLPGAGSEIVEVMRYADHLAAIQQADKSWGDLSRDNWQDGYEQAIRDAVSRVEAIPADGGWISNGKVWRFQAIAAIKGDSDA